MPDPGAVICTLSCERKFRPVVMEGSSQPEGFEVLKIIIRMDWLEGEWEKKKQAKVAKSDQENENDRSNFTEVQVTRVSFFPSSFPFPIFLFLLVFSSWLAPLHSSSFL